MIGIIARLAAEIISRNQARNKARPASTARIAEK